MKFLRTVILVFGLLPLAANAQEVTSSGVVYFPDQMVSKLFQTGGRLLETPEYKVSLSHREGPGQSEIHHQETDIFYVVDGSATFVSGGKLVGAKHTGMSQIRGTGIEGGDVYELRKGAVVVIPAGTAHWFKEVHGTVDYYVVKVLK